MFRLSNLTSNRRRVSDQVATTSDINFCIWSWLKTNFFTSSQSQTGQQAAHHEYVEGLTALRRTPALGIEALSDGSGRQSLLM
jgi:DNA-directed RNA polymerase beta subunit